MNSQNSQRGFSLIELVIAMTVTLIIAGIASTLVAQSFRMRAREDARSDAIADAQRALNIVSRELANSGFGLIDNGLVPDDTSSGSVRFRSDLNAYVRDGAGDPVPTAGLVSDADEDVKYSMYHDTAANRHYLVRFDVTLGGREGTTVLANKLNDFRLTYYDKDGNLLDVDANALNCRDAWKIKIEVGVDLPAEGQEGSPGYQPPSSIRLISDVVLRNASQITY